MSSTQIINRLRAACASGTLQPIPDFSAALAVTTVGDLLQAWGDVYPGITVPQEEFNRSVFGYKGLRRPALTASARRSRRPLPAPRQITPVPKIIDPGLFTSIQAIWAWYQQHDLAQPGLLHGPFTGDGLAAFVLPLWEAVEDWYPLGINLESIGYENPIRLSGISMVLPHESYDDERGGIVEGFLRGADGLHWVLQNFYDCRADYDIILPVPDLRLIDKIGFCDLTKCYAGHKGEKTVDLIKLENWEKSYFSKIVEQWPDQWAKDYDIISAYGDGTEVVITSAADIDFALAWGAAFERMIGDMPDPGSLHENCGGITEEFIHEICNAWRRENHKRIVKWTSPKQETISHRIKVGEL